MQKMEIVYISQLVSDQEKALQFYTKTLGFEKRKDAPNPGAVRFVTVAPPGQAFQLVLWPGKPGAPQEVYGRVPAAVTIEVSNCRAGYEELKARGVRFDTDVLEFPWGWVAVFQDLDGNRLQLRQGR